MQNADKGTAASPLDGKELRIGIVQARFNESITNALAAAFTFTTPTLALPANLGNGLTGQLWTNVNPNTDTLAQAQAIISGGFGMRCASESPAGAMTMPQTPISAAAR